MKFKTEVEINWLDENETIDGKLSQAIIKEITARLQDTLTSEIKLSIAKRATAIIDAKVAQIIDSTLEQPIEIQHSWNKRTNYDSIYDMIEEEMTKLYKGKLDADGKCNPDPLLSRLQSYVKNEYDKQFNKTKTEVIRAITQYADEQFKKSETLEMLKSMRGSKQ